MSRYDFHLVYSMVSKIFSRSRGLASSVQLLKPNRSGEAAEMNGQELDYRIKRLTAVIEPALIVFVGVLVGFIAATLISAIYSLAGSYQ